MPRTIALPSPAATRRLATRVAKGLRPGDVLALVGPLGAGKTTFVRALVEALGGDPAEVVSPTFVLATRYAAGCRIPLVHVDAYRLEGAEEFRNLGHEMLFPADSATVIEWADRVRDALPSRTVRIEMQPSGRSSRTARIGGPAARVSILFGLGRRGS